MTDHDPYAAFRVPAYRLFAGGYVLAILGSQIFAAAVQWDVYELTGSELALAGVGIINALPILLLALPAGHLVDVVPRKAVLLATQILLIAIPSAMAYITAAASRDVRLQALYLLAGVNAVTLTFARPARASLLPNLVPRELYGNAFTWISSLFETAAWIGPALAGVALQWGSAWAYRLSGACLTVCFLLSIFLPDPRVARAQEAVSWSSLLAGLRFVGRTRLLLAAMSLDLLAVLLGGATYLLPVFARERLFVGETGFGWLRAGPAVGACLMAIVQAHYPIQRRAGRKLLLAVIGFGLATIGFGLSETFWLSFVMLLILGACDNISVVLRHTLVQTLTPDEMRGRVSAVNQVFIGASNDLGGVESGLLAAWCGPVFSVVFGGVGAIAVTLGVAAASPELRRLDSPTRPEGVDESVKI